MAIGQEFWDPSRRHEDSPHFPPHPPLSPDKGERAFQTPSQFGEKKPGNCVRRVKRRWSWGGNDRKASSAGSAAGRLCEPSRVLKNGRAATNPSRSVKTSPNPRPRVAGGIFSLVMKRPTGTNRARSRTQRGVGRTKKPQVVSASCGQSPFGGACESHILL